MEELGRFHHLEALKRARIALLRSYAKNGSKFTQDPVVHGVENWIRDAVLLTATAVIDALDKLAQEYPTKQELWRNILVNRILRGVLWTILNRSAPGSDPLAEETYRLASDRSLECSLSSKLLYSNDIMYIS